MEVARHPVVQLALPRGRHPARRDEETPHQRADAGRGRDRTHDAIQRQPGEGRLRQMAVGQHRPHHRAVSELGPDAGHGAVRGPEVPPGLLLKKPQLLAGRPCRRNRQVDLDHSGGQGQALDTQMHQVQDLPDVESRRRGADPLDPLGPRRRGRRVQPQAELEAGQRLLPRRHHPEQRIERLLDPEQQALDIGLRRIEVEMARERLDCRRGLEGDDQVPRRLAMQPMRLAAEPPADAGGRQPQERPEGADPELVEGVAQTGVDVEPAQEDAAGRLPLGRGVAEHRHPAVRPPAVRFPTGSRQRIRAEPGEPHHHPAPEPRRPQMPPHPARPVHQGGEQRLQPGGIEPEHAGMGAGRLDAGREPPEQPGNRGDAGLDIAGGHLGRAEGAGQREPRGVGHAGQHPGPAGRLVHPLDDPLRPVAVDHRRRLRRPPRMPAHQQLERQRRHVNTGHPVHDTPRRASTRARPACP